jgi:tripartite-type tricarboxylate transporter receptor subunit TctC
MWKEFVASLDTPLMKRIWAEQGADAGGMSQADMAKLVHSEIGKWAKVVKDAGAKIDN